MSDNEENNNYLVDQYQSKPPPTPPSDSDSDSLEDPPKREITFDEDFEFLYETAILKDENLSVFGKEWSLWRIIEKFLQDEPAQLPDSEQKQTMRDLVDQFFSNYHIPPGTLRVHEKCFVGSNYIPEYVKSFSVGDFFSSKRILDLRKLYAVSFTSFSDLINPYSVNSLTYKDEMKVKYIPFQLFRILLLDILDFIDFLEGSELPPKYFIGDVTSEVQLSRIRDEFEKGVQQIEFGAIGKLENDFNSFVLQTPPASNQNILSFKTFAHGVNPNEDSLPSVKTHFYKLDPELDKINDAKTHMKQLRSLQEINQGYMLSTVSRSAEILKYCVKTPACKFQFSIQRLICGIYERLDELKDLRIICTRYLAALEKSHNPQLMFKLKLKVKIGLVLKEIFNRILCLLGSFSFHKE